MRIASLSLSGKLRAGLRGLCLVLACLPLSLAGGCLSAQQHGVTADGAYISTSRPAVQVAVRDMKLVTFGAGTGSLLEPGTVGGLSVDTWLAVYASAEPAKAMAAVIHAELTGWTWSTVWPHPGSVDARTESIGGRPYAACTFLQTVNRDPFAGLGGEPWSADTEDEQPAYWLVRYMAGLYTHNEEKIVLEYREPAPEGELTPELLDGFRRRALAAFTVGGPASTDNVRAGYPDGVRWRYVDDSLLGPVMPKEIID